MAQNVKVAIRIRNLPTWHGRDGKKDSAEYNANIIVADQPDAAKVNRHLVIGDAAMSLELKDFNFDYVFPSTGIHFI